MNLNFTFFVKKMFYRTRSQWPYTCTTRCASLSCPTTVCRTTATARTCVYLPPGWPSTLRAPAVSVPTAFCWRRAAAIVSQIRSTKVSQFASLKFDSITIYQQLWSFLLLCKIRCYCVSYSYSKTLAYGIKPVLVKMSLICMGSCTQPNVRIFSLYSWLFFLDIDLECVKDL